MIAHNASFDANGSRIVVTNREEQMEIYDSLPLHWKNLIASLPVPQDLREVKQVLKQWGEERGFEAIVAVFRDKYPTWTLPKGYF